MSSLSLSLLPNSQERRDPPAVFFSELKFEERFGTPKDYSGWFVTRVCLTINLDSGYANLDFDANDHL